ncbi:MAG: carbohydrate-binding family 9-like protein [Spirochaetales bacterium]
MKSVTALRLAKDHELSGDIVPEVYLKCQAIRELEYPWASNTFERQLTEVRAAWTDKYLYVHLWAKDSWVVAKETKPKGKVYEDDCLEVFLRPDPQAGYIGWEVNALGTLLEYTVEGWGQGPVEYEHFDYKWKSAAQWKVRRHDAGFVLELRIPFAKDLGQVPQRGDVWGATFNRLDLDRQGRQSLSTWSRLGPEKVWFHQPSGFGQLVFG